MRTFSWPPPRTTTWPLTRVDTDSAAAPAPTRATRWGEVGPDQRREVRSRFGTTVWAARLAAGPTQAGLAARAGVSERTVRALEAGTQRPSDATTAALAAALCPHRDALTIAVLDIELQIAAGASLRPRHRRRPPRVRVSGFTRRPGASSPSAGRLSRLRTWTRWSASPWPRWSPSSLIRGPAPGARRWGRRDGAGAAG